MSVYDFYKRTTGKYTSQNGMDKTTLGQQYKSESDMLMDELWWNDPQSKVCYIYDYFHDDQPDLKDHMTYSHTTKIRIDAKFIVKSYQSIDKDQVEYYLQFRPSQKVEFEPKDELYYYETEYRQRYGSEFPIGCYCDIPDDKGVYRKWLICAAEPANQFPKYLILPCDYRLTWVERNGQQTNLRAMWVVTRNQNSYTIGQYTDRYFTRPDNQNKIWMPLNPLTEKFWYNTEETTTMRLVVSAPTERPVVWSVTKIENTKPIGIQKLTLYQTVWDKSRDMILRDENGKIIDMYADYYSSEAKIEPTEPPRVDIPQAKLNAQIVATNAKIKVGGTYKLLTAKLTDESNMDVTEDYSSATFTWTCSVDNEDMTDKVTWLDNTTEYNQTKLKFPADKSYLTKILTVKCSVVKDGITVLTITGDFELS